MGPKGLSETGGKVRDGDLGARRSLPMKDAPSSPCWPCVGPRIHHQMAPEPCRRAAGFGEHQTQGRGQHWAEEEPGVVPQRPKLLAVLGEKPPPHLDLQFCRSLIASCWFHPTVHTEINDPGTHPPLLLAPCLLPPQGLGSQSGGGTSPVWEPRPTPCQQPWAGHMMPGCQWAARVGEGGSRFKAVRPWLERGSGAGR